MTSHTSTDPTPAPAPTDGRRARPGRAVLATETRLFLREPGSLFWILVFPTVLLLIMDLIPTTDTGPGAPTFVEQYTPVACLLAAIMAALLAMPAVVGAYREQQVLRRIATTPARAWHVLGAQVALHALAVAVSIVLLLVVARYAFDVPFPEAPAAWVLAYALALVATLATGALIAGTAPSMRMVTTIASVVFFPTMFTAGVWYPVSAMSGTLLDIVSFTPMGAAALALDEAQLGGWPSAIHLAVVAAWALGLSALATRYFRWEA